MTGSISSLSQVCQKMRETSCAVYSLWCGCMACIMVKGTIRAVGASVGDSGG